MQKYTSTLILLASAAFIAPAALADDPQTTNAADRPMATDFKGRPPFARNRAPAETTDLARFEETAAATTSRRADFRGRPPFSRHSDRPRTSADFARFEETDAGTKVRRRMGPPGKMTSRR